jgi:hypothetical protein
LLWEQRTHQQLTGRQVRQLLQEPKPDSLVPVSQHIRASAR